MVIRKALAAAAFVMAATGSQAATLSDLVAGATLAVEDVVFSGFTYDDIGGYGGDVAVPTSSIEVTATSTADAVSLRFDFFAPILLGGDEVFEIVGAFDAQVTGGSSRTFVGTTLELLSATIGPGPITAIEIGQTDRSTNTLLNINYFDNSGVLQLFDSAPLPGLTAFSHGWDASGETDVDSSAELRAFAITYQLDGATPSPIPLPAGLPLLLAALGGFGVLGARRGRSTAQGRPSTSPSRITAGS